MQKKALIDEESIIDKLKPLKPERVILFGSFARGNPTSDSDIDLLIIQKTKQKISRRIDKVIKLFWGNIPHIEPQVLTPKEFKQAIKENRYFITQEILKHGKILYEKH